MAKTVLVSACLLGVNCRFDATARSNPELLKKLRDCAVVPVCPEQLGGLPTPRSPAEITGGDGHDVLDGRAKVVNEQGEDVTSNYVRGAREVLTLAKLFGANRAYLKSKSPACGCGRIKRCGKTVEGDGVCAALLKRHDIQVIEV